MSFNSTSGHAPCIVRVLAPRISSLFVILLPCTVPAPKRSEMCRTGTRTKQIILLFVILPPCIVLVQAPKRSLMFVIYCHALYWYWHQRDSHFLLFYRHVQYQYLHQKIGIVCYFIVMYRTGTCTTVRNIQKPVPQF